MTNKEIFQPINWIYVDDALPPRDGKRVLLHVMLVVNLKKTNESVRKTLVVEAYLSIKSKLVYSDRAKKYTLAPCHGLFLSFKDWVLSSAEDDYPKTCELDDFDEKDIDNFDLDFVTKEYRTINVLDRTLRWAYL